ncbi:5'-methylthioadenosine/S-adenosylhomocysteine nucleosidase [Streptomyces rhizosphaericus]|uniref:5'-methylthioadenosine/S-adenosylhomocysteine nucleosidase n=1 Tax=Streptomyces rhizosphaericus TaxID=114699 RepID=A0A6G4AHA6_9ACTN|nr:5'-methylthioadenosine/S-adenosylhomocysteine nucleosidase [Streptomyces rhizosphaericus]NEW72194.1 5'-methylthioadenosine/S-adenosylhomocysteine nucleosidase [Streptomyces rhizosphaericus]
MGAEGNGGAVRADVVVLTALEVEYRAVRAHLEDPRPVQAERGAVFELGVFREGSGERRVAIHMTGPGNPGAAASVERAAALFAPRAVLFVGVAGGIKDVALGDVVAADAVYDYETGKDTESGFLPRQKTHQSAYGLVQLARLVAAADAWQRRIRPGDDAPRPRAHVKPLAAGGRVVAHHRSDVGLRLAASAGDALAVDMEGFGFLAGAYANQQLDALVIRGISDLLGDKGEAHDERWQPVASQHAAAFAFELIGRIPTADPAVPRPLATDARPLATGTRSLATGAPPETPRRRRLTIRDLGVLADTLLAVDGMTSPARWQQLLDELPTVGTAVGRQSASRAEALSLLRVCEARRAMGELVEVVAVLAPDDPAAAELARRVEELGLE